MAAPKLRCRKCRAQGYDGLLVEPHSKPGYVVCVDCGHNWKSVHSSSDQMMLFPHFYTPDVLAALAAGDE